MSNVARKKRVPRKITPLIKSTNPPPLPPKPRKPKMIRINITNSPKNKLLNIVKSSNKKQLKEYVNELFFRMGRTPPKNSDFASLSLKQLRDFIMDQGEAFSAEKTLEIVEPLHIVNKSSISGNSKGDLIKLVKKKRDAECKKFAGLSKKTNAELNSLLP